MAWFHLLVAAAFEVAFAMGMKFSNGFGRLWPAAWREPDGGEADFCRVDRRRGGRAQVSDAALGLQSAAFPFLREQPC